MRRSIRSASTGAMLVYAALAPMAAAQSVSGTIVDRTQRAVAGVVVELLDSTMTSVAHSVSSSTGAYSLRATRAGRFQVRTRQVGFAPVLSSPITLTAGASSNVTLTFEPIAFALDTVRVSSRTVCGRASDSTLAVVAALEYARTALLGTDVVRARGVQSTSMRFERLLDPIRERVQRQSITMRADSLVQPWSSLPIGTIRVLGYVVNVGDTVQYKLPGLDMLASTAFVDDHCFKFSGKSDAKRIGVSFEPTSTRKTLAEIQGTLWLDRTTARLLSIEFRYANLEGAQDDAKPGGAMSFERLRDGTFVVSEWSVRMPVLERRVPAAKNGARVGSGLPETVVAGIRVEGGQLVSVTSRAANVAAIDTIWARPGLAVSGEVIDSLTDKRVSGARVGLEGTSLEVVSGSDGMFVLNGVLPGEYIAYVRTPSLDSVRASSTFPLTISATQSGLKLKAANASTVVALLCPAGRVATADRGAIFGQVSGDTSALSGEARVSIEWPSDGAATGAIQWISTRANADGSFRACSVPMDRPITLRASTSRAAAQPVHVTVSTSTRFASARLTLDAARAGSAVFTGLVVADSTMTPVVDAEVLLPQLSRSVHTNAEGRFRISDVPAGSHRLTVRRLGFSPVEAVLPFVANEIVDRRVVLGKVSVIDSVIVRADYLDPGMREFEERRKLGIGQFRTRSDLAKEGAPHISETLQMVSGTNIMAIQGHLFAMSARRSASGSGKVNCFFFEGRQPLNECRQTSECVMAVMIDDLPLFLGRDGETVPDLGRIAPNQIEAVEVYSSVAQIPAKYGGVIGRCGLIVLHRRR